MDEFESVDKEVLRKAMREAIKKMTRTQSLCVLALVAGWTQAEVGELLDIDQSTVSRSYSKALLAIKMILIALMHN